MSAPTAGELAGRSETNRALLERLISNTANIIRDQKKWFDPARSGATSPSPLGEGSPVQLVHVPTPVEAMRAATFGTAAAGGRSLSPGLPRRAQERSLVASPSPATQSRAVSPTTMTGRERSPVRMSPTLMGGSFTHMQSPWQGTLSPPLSPELAPPSTGRTMSPMRERSFEHTLTAMPATTMTTTTALHHGPTLRALRACERVQNQTTRDIRYRAMIRWLSYTVHRRPGQDTARVQHLSEMLRVSNADAEVAQARMEAAEARAERSAMGAFVNDSNAMNVRVQGLQREAEEARVTAAAALRTLDEARAELDVNRAEFEALLAQRAGGDSKMLDAQLKFQEAMLQKSRMQQELAGVRAAEEQREKENRHLRDELTAERTRLETELASCKIVSARELEIGLTESRKEYDVRMQRLHGELDSLRRELNDSHTLRAEHESLKVQMSAIKGESDGLRQGEMLMRDQLEARLRELEVVHNELKTSRIDAARLQERLQLTEIKAIGSGDLAMKDAHAEVLRHSQSQSLRLEEQLRDRAAAAAAAEAQLASNSALLLRSESELEGKNQRIRWLEEEAARRDHALGELNKQLADARAEKEAILRESINDRAAAAAAQAQHAAAAEKAAMLLQQLEQIRAEAIDSRVQLTELRAQLASTLARLEGREDALLVLKDELQRTRDQLAAAEHLLSARARNNDENGHAQRTVEEKEKLIEHLEGRIKGMQDALDGKDKEIADLRAQLDAMTRAKNLLEAERDQLLRDMKDRDDEIDRLRRLVQELQEKLAGFGPMQRELELLQTRIRELEMQNRDQSEEIRRLEDLIAKLRKQLEERTHEVELLTEELRRQILLTQSATNSANTANRRLMEAEEQRARESIEKDEAEERAALLRRRYQAQIFLLQQSNKRIKQKAATVLERRNLAKRLMGYWTALAGHAGRKSSKSMKLFIQEKDLLSNAVTDLHGVVKQQAKKINDLESALKGMKRRAADALLSHTNWRKLAEGYWKLLCNTRRARTKTTVVRPQLRGGAAPAKRIIPLTSSYSNSVQGSDAGGSTTVKTIRHRARVVQPFSSVRIGLLCRYMMMWQRWRIRRLARYKVGDMQRRNENLVRMRVAGAFLLNMCRKLRTVLESSDTMTVSHHSRAQRRYEAARRRTSAALASAAMKSLGHRYLNKWKRYWEERRLGKMTSRMKNIERLLVGKERPFDGTLTLDPYRSSEPAVLPFIERDEAVMRGEILRQESLGFAKLCRVCADLKNSAMAAALLEAELGNAFVNTERGEGMDRMFIETMQGQGYQQLLQDALWEGQLGWARRARLASLLQIEVESLGSQNAVLAGQVVSTEAQRDSVAARSMHESRRGDLAEVEITNLSRERANLSADNVALAKQLEATASHLSGMDAQVSREGANASELRRELAGKDHQVAGLRSGIVETEARLASTTAELQQLRNELHDARAQLEDKAREALETSTGALQQQSLQREELKHEFAKMEVYGAGLQEENARLKAILVAELGRMQGDGDMTTQIQTEALMRLQMDRDELMARLELAFLMMQHPTQHRSLTMMSPPKQRDLLQDSQGLHNTRRDVVASLDAAWRENEKTWLVKLERMVEDWRQLMISDAYINMTEVQRSQVMEDLHRSCVTIARDLQSQRQLSDNVFVQGLNDYNVRVAEEEMRATTRVQKRRFDEQTSRSHAEMQAGEAAWEANIGRLIAQWKEYSTSQQFLLLPAAQQAEAVRQHSNQVARERQLVGEERTALQEAQRTASAALEASISSEEAHARDTVRVREDALTRQALELADQSRSWGGQLDSFIRELDLLISDHATYDELGEFNAQVYSAWALASASRSQTLERHGAELVGLYPQSVLSVSNGPVVSVDVQNIAHLLMGRQRIVALVAEGMGLAGDGRRSLQQAAELFTQLPFARNLAPSVLAPLQRALGQGRASPSPGGSRMSSRAGSMSTYEEEGGKWQQLASRGTRATSLRRSAVSRSIERSATPGMSEDPMARQRAVNIVDKLEFTLSLLTQLEGVFQHAGEQLTQAERGALGLSGGAGVDLASEVAALQLSQSQLTDLCQLAPALMQRTAM